MKRRYILKSTLLVGTLFLGISLAGCNSKTEDTAEESTEVKEEAEETEASESDGIIGEKAEGDNVFHLLVTNETGANIISVQVDDDSTDDFGENLMQEDDVFETSQTYDFYYDGTDAIEANEQNDASEGSGLEANPGYDLRITFEDESTYDLHGFPMEDTDEVKLQLSDDVCYITYMSKETGEEVDTKDTELGLIELNEMADSDSDEDTSTVTTDTKPATSEQQTAPTQQAAPETQTVVPDTTSSPDEGCLTDDIIIN